MDLEKTHGFLDPRKLFKTNSEYKTLRTQLTEYESQENKLRTQFLNLLQKTTENQYYATVNSEPVYLTYKGRELLGTLSERLKRVGKMDLKQYIQELEDIKNKSEEQERMFSANDRIRYLENQVAVFRGPQGARGRASTAFARLGRTVHLRQSAVLHDQTPRRDQTGDLRIAKLAQQTKNISIMR